MSSKNKYILLALSAVLITMHYCSNDSVESGFRPADVFNSQSVSDIFGSFSSNDADVLNYSGRSSLSYRVVRPANYLSSIKSSTKFLYKQLANTSSNARTASGHVSYIFWIVQEDSPCSSNLYKLRRFNI